MTRNRAIFLRSVVEQAAASLDDKTASAAASLFPVLYANGNLIISGTRINWNGQLKRAAVDLWDTRENNPDNAPALWEDIDYRDGHRLISNVITVGLKFSLGETGWWGDVLCRSKIDNNLWTPSEYPDGWEVM